MHQESGSAEGEDARRPTTQCICWYSGDLGAAFRPGTLKATAPRLLHTRCLGHCLSVLEGVIEILIGMRNIGFHDAPTVVVLLKSDCGTVLHS
jgi:hypothetical protein